MHSMIETLWIEERTNTFSSRELDETGDSKQQLSFFYLLLQIPEGTRF